jgi:hypothetical protein
MSESTRMDTHVRELHDRSTRGLALSADEQVELDAWYAALDQTEVIGQPAGAAPPSVEPLQSQVDEALTTLRGVTERIQELAAGNDALRREIAVLQARVTQRQTAHAS